MSWTYIPSMDEYDKEVTKDPSTYDRYTFKRYMYFKPDQYDKWAKGQNYSGVPYTAELVGNSNIPSAGVHLAGSLSNFYVNDIVSINSLSEEEHGDACSYAVVTIEYENKISNSGGGGSSDKGEQSSQPSRGLKPWQRHVEDFTITNQEVQIPLIKGYDVTSGYLNPPMKTIATTAGQPLYGFNGSLWIQRLSWTYCSIGEDYSMDEPLINSSGERLFDKIVIPANKGLLLPPSYKKMYYYEDANDQNPIAYDQWNFEIIVNEAQGFDIEILNAGTKAISGNAVYDICTWYIYDPLNPPGNVTKLYGNFGDMISAKMAVDAYNKTIRNDADKQVWSGDFVQGPVPLTAQGNYDIAAIMNPTNTYKLKYRQYKAGSWNLGTR